MGIYQRAKQLFKRSSSNVQHGLANPSEALLKLLQVEDMADGVAVNETSAVELEAVYACVKNISEDIGSLSIDIIKRQADGEKTKAHDHYLFDLIHWEPNAHDTRQSLLESLVRDLLLFGNGFLEIERSGTKVVGLHPLPACTFERTYDRDGVRVFGFHHGEMYDEDDIIHIRGFGDEVTGSRPVKILKRVFASALSTEHYAQKYFAKGTHLGGVIYSDSPDSDLGDDGRKSLRKDLNSLHKGLGNAFSVLMLNNGFKFQPFQNDAEKAQLLESRKYNVERIARMYRMPPHLIQDLSRATFSNIYEQSQEYVDRTLRPILDKIEQQFRKKLLTSSEKKQGFFLRFNAAALLRMKPDERAQYLATLRNQGIIDGNQWADIEDFPRFEGGDIRIVPLNMVSLDVIRSVGVSTPDAMDEPTENEAAQDGSQSDPEEKQIELEKQTRELRLTAGLQVRDRIASRFEKLFKEAANRVGSKEVKAIERAAKKYLSTGSVENFIQWLQDFYAELEGDVKAAFAPVFHAFAEAVHDVASSDLGNEPDFDEGMQVFANAMVAAFAVRYVGKYRKSMIINAKEGQEAVADQLAKWQEDRADAIAAAEMAQSGNATIRETYKRAGVTALRWVTIGSDNCELCNRLDGKTVGIESAFVSEGETVETEGDTAPLRVKQSIKHPPLHRGCNCTIVPA